MIKLITPPGMLLTTAMLLIYSVYALMIGSIESSVPLLVGGVMAVVATYGVAMVKPWSRYLVYALTTGFVAKLADSIYWGVRSGYYSSQFSAPDEAVRSLLPSFTLFIMALVCCWIVNRHFTHPASEQVPRSV